MTVFLWVLPHLAVSAPLQTPSSPEGQSPVVVELFSSQGCPACPPANALLSKLAKQQGVFVLSWQVDYWDFLGWKDPFAKAAFTERQEKYNVSMGRRGIMTPEFIIQGQRYTFGASEQKVRGLIASLDQGRPHIVPVIDDKGDHYQITLPDQEAIKRALVSLLLIRRSYMVDIKGGDNAGNQVRYHNVVLEQQAVGSFQGKSTAFEVQKSKMPKLDYDGLAVMVQDDQVGPIYGVGTLIFNSFSDH